MPCRVRPAALRLPSPSSLPQKPGSGGGGTSTEGSDGSFSGAANRRQQVSDALRSGKRLVEIGRLDRAHKQFTRALELAPDNAQAHYGLGFVAFQQSLGLGWGLGKGRQFTL